MDAKIEAIVKLAPQNEWYIKRRVRLNDNIYDGEICYLLHPQLSNSASEPGRAYNLNALDQIILKAIQATFEHARLVNENDIRMFDADFEEDNIAEKSEMSAFAEITINKVEKVHIQECSEELDRTIEHFAIKVQYFGFDTTHIPLLSIKCEENEYEELKRLSASISTLSEKYKSEQTK